MTETVLLGLATIVLFGTAAQWLAWRLRLPSILLLLLAGFAAGPEALGWVDPDTLFGPLLFPLISLSVAVLLFEGGLTLHFDEVTQHGRVVTKLITVGAAITWLLTTLLAWLFLDLPGPLSVLLGAVLVVTGPTVVQPLLRQIRPKGPAASILKWEGILIDPVGAVLAVLVYEAIIAAGPGAATGHALWGIGKTLIFGSGIGLAGAGLLVLLLRRYWIPDHLHSPFALGLTVGAFFAANHVQEESGLLAVTVMGVALANQSKVSVRHILEFKENLRVLILSTLFIILAARVDLGSLQRFDPGTISFLLGIILVVRPLQVLYCTRGSNLELRDKIFLMCLAPRGIVAAAVAAVFALRLEAAGDPNAAAVVSVTFLVILTTVVVYGLGAGRVARKLGLAEGHPQGVLFLGASEWVRDFARALNEAGIATMLVDTNRRRIREARLAGLRTYLGNLLTEETDQKLDLQGIGRLAAVTSNDSVNALAALHFAHLFGREEVYQLAEKGAEKAPELRGRVLFSEDIDAYDLRRAIERGHRFRATNITEQFDFEAWRGEHGDEAIPLAVLREDGRLQIATADRPAEPGDGDTLIALVRPVDDPANGGARSA